MKVSSLSCALGLISACGFFTGKAIAETTLAAGDLSFLAGQSDDPDRVTFVTWVPLESGTVIKFTDNGFTTNGSSSNGSEGGWIFTTTTVIDAGTVIAVVGGSPSNGSVTTFGTPALSASGDQVFAYQGSYAGGTSFSGTLVAGVNFGIASDPTVSPSQSNKTQAPTTLVDAYAFVDLGNRDEIYYKGTRSGLTNSIYRAATNASTNFTATDTIDSSYDHTTSFSVSTVAELYWDANTQSAGTGSTGTWDSTTSDYFQDGAGTPTYFRWVNSSLNNEHTAVFGGTAGVVSVGSGGVTASGLKFVVDGYTVQNNTITLRGDAAVTVSTASHTATVSSTLAGSSGLNKSGPGKVVLSSSNSYTGNTNIQGGTLALSGSGSIANSPIISVASAGNFDVSSVTGGFSLASGQKLTGTGTVYGTMKVGSGSTIAPGNSPGTLTEAGNLTMEGGGAYEWEINKWNGAEGTDPGWDLIQVTGASNTVNITATPANPFVIKIVGLKLDNTEGSVPNFVSGTPKVFTIARAPGGITGYQPYAFLVNVDKWNSNNSPGKWWTQVSNDGKDLQLYYVGVPEPTTLSLLALSGMGLLRRRRK